IPHGKSQKYLILPFSKALVRSFNILAYFSSFIAGPHFIPFFMNFLSVMSGKVWPSIFCLRRILKSSLSRFMFRSHKKIMRVLVSQFLTKEERFAVVEDMIIYWLDVENKKN